MYKVESKPGHTVPWFRYVFLKQYCELKNRVVGVARLVGEEHMGRCVRA